MPRSTVRCALLLTLAVVSVLVAVDWPAWFVLPSHEVGDLAANALQIERCKQVVEIHGNYSRFAFNHPGPGFFYVYALGQVVLHDWLGLVPSPHNAHRLAGLCLQAFFFALALAIFRRHVRTPLFVPLALLLAALHFGLGQNAFTSLWAPHQPLMPFLCFFVACCSVASGTGSHLPAAMLAGCFLVHGHVAQPLFVVPLFTAGYVALWLRMRSASPRVAPWRAFGKAHVGAAAILALALLPMVIDWLHWPDCNLERILNHCRYSGDDRHSVKSSLVYLASFFSYRQDQEVIMASGAWQALLRLREGWGWYVAWVAVFAVVAWWWRRPRGSAPDTAMAGRPFLRMVVVFWLSAILLAVAWGVIQTGLLYGFNSHFYFSLLFVPLLALAAALSQWWTVCGVRATAALLCLASVAGAWRMLALPSGTLEVSGLPVLAATNVLLDADPRREMPKLLVMRIEDWPNVAGIGLALVRQGRSFTVAPNAGFVFGRYRTMPSQVPSPTLEDTSVWRFVRGAADGAGTPVVEDLKVLFEPGRIDPAQSSIDCASDGDFGRFYVSGFMADIPGPQDQGHWTTWPEAVFQVTSAPAARDVELVISAQPVIVPPLKSQSMELRVNGHAVGSGLLDVNVLQDVKVRIPMAVWNLRPQVTFVMHMTSAQSPAQLGMSGDTRRFGWAVRKLTFRYVD